MSKCSFSVDVVKQNSKCKREELANVKNKIENNKENKDENENIDYDSILGNKKGKKISLLDTSNKKYPNVYSMESLSEQRLREQFRVHGLNKKIHAKYELSFVIY